jgi:hypothetical protein
MSRNTKALPPPSYRRIALTGWRPGNWLHDDRGGAAAFEEPGFSSEWGWGEERLIWNDNSEIFPRVIDPLPSQDERCCHQ